MQPYKYIWVEKQKHCTMFTYTPKHDGVCLVYIGEGEFVIGVPPYIISLMSMHVINCVGTIVFNQAKPFVF